MLDDLHIESLGVIEDATVTFGPGLNVLTGETGAGKTMLVTALGLLLGSRADAALVRTGAPRASVEARLTLPRDGADEQVARRVSDAGGLLDDDQLVVGRHVAVEGRSRATAGGATVPAGLLAEVTGALVVIHGQSDQHRLLQAATQRDLLDRAGGAELLAQRDRHEASFRRLAALDAEIREIVEHARARAREADQLRLGLGEVDAAQPVPGEDAALLDEERRLAHADGLRRAAEQARQALAGDDDGLAPDALGLVAAARSSLEAERDHDPALGTLAESLASASYALADVAADIASYASLVDTDSTRLSVVSERRAVLASLTRKYGETVDDVLAWAADARERLAELDADESRTTDLEHERTLVAGELQALGAELTARRRLVGDDLATRVSAELGSLAMGGTAFGVAVSALSEPIAIGQDEVTFQLEAAGSGPVPIARGASGGELSRVMLALELCLHDDAPTPTLVFDEVDAGVGGKAAVELGRRLARLARSTQVVVVTHLPQVAAFADVHHVVAKSSDGTVTTSGVTALDETGRLRELSRMLAGLEDSETALAHARELVDLARTTRTGD